MKPGEVMGEGQHPESEDLALQKREAYQRFSAVWQDALGLSVDSTDEVVEQGVRVAMLPIGETHIELLEPLSDSSPVGKFLQKRGPGIHHIAIKVTDIRKSLDELKTKGARLIDETPRVGANGCLVAFVHPTATNGVLLELVQHQD